MKEIKDATTKELETIREELDESDKLVSRAVNRSIKGEENPYPYRLFKMRELVDHKAITKKFGISKRGLRLMRDSVGLPFIRYTHTEDSELTKRLGFKLGETYYLPREFEDLDAAGKLDQFRLKPKPGLGPQ